MKIKALLSLFAFVAASASADVLFDNTSGTVIGGWGYFNPSAAWGDEVTLAGNATITSFSFDISSVFSTYNNGPLTLAIYNVDAGADGLLQTADDKIGSLIGNYSQSLTISAGRNTISGFSIQVPGSFIYTLTNGSNLSYMLEATKDVPTTGSSSNSNIWVNFGSGGLPVGTQSSSTYAPNNGNNQVMFQGASAVPEPSSMALLTGAAGLLWMMRLRRRRR